MNNTMRWIPVTLAVLFTACQAQHIPEGDPIAVCAGVADTQVTAKGINAIPFEGSAPTGSNPLHAALWFGTSSGNYAVGSDNGYPPCRTTGYFIDSRLTYPAAILHYPEAEASVYCVGLYPSTDWNPGDGTAATHAIDGQTDLMYAPQLTASSASRFSTASPLTFRHLLTWIRVSVVANEADAINSWGNITSITISSKSSVTVTLGNADPLPSNGITYATDNDYPLFSSSGMSLLTTYQDLSESILCAPATSYTFTVTTSNVAAKEITVDLTDMEGDAIASADDAMGKQFVVLLRFNKFKMIDASATLTEWVDASSIELKP